MSRLETYLRTQLSFLCILIFPRVAKGYFNDFPLIRSTVSNCVYHTLCELDIHSWEIRESLAPLKAHEKFQFFERPFNRKSSPNEDQVRILESKIGRTSFLFVCASDYIFTHN